MKTEQTAVTSIGLSRVLVWDLPTRVFHWLLVTLVIVSFVTGNIGGNAMQYHEWSGCAILALLVFRGVWGFIGSEPSRFKSFLKGPAVVLRYAASTFRRDPECLLTHNPLGGWSVVALLTVLLVQAGTGLFANDDIATEGPLYLWVSKKTSNWITGVHDLNAGVIVALVALHVAAVLFHLIYKGENLVTPMITGAKHCSGIAGNTLPQPLWRAALVAAVAALAVYVLVR